MERCSWAGTESMIAYHDEEWGVPEHDDRALFEFLVLEGAQAGLSWSTILNKRENYRRGLDQLPPQTVAVHSPIRVAEPGAEAPWFFLRGHHYHLCVHAGDRHRQRPLGGLLPPLTDRRLGCLKWVGYGPRIAQRGTFVIASATIL